MGNTKKINIDHLALRKSFEDRKEIVLRESFRIVLGIKTIQTLEDINMLNQLHLKIFEHSNVLEFLYKKYTKAILNFFNKMQEYQETFTVLGVEDEFKEDLFSHIISARNDLSERKFTEIRQIDSIAGMNDIIWNAVIKEVTKILFISYDEGLELVNLHLHSAIRDELVDLFVTKDSEKRIIDSTDHRIIFDSIFDVFGKINGLSNNLKVKKLQDLVKEKTLETELDFLLKDEVKDILSKPIEITLCKKLVSLFYDENIGLPFIELLFDADVGNQIIKLLNEPRINPSNIKFGERGIELAKKIEYEEFDIYERLGEFDDFAVDFCGNIFTISKNANGFQINRFLQKEKTVMPLYRKEERDIKEVRIKAEDTYLLIFTRTSETEKIFVFQRARDRIKELFGIHNIKDFTIDRCGNLITLSKGGEIFRIDNLKPEHIKKLPYTVSKNTSRIQAGIDDDNIYGLSSNRKTITIYNKNINKLKDLQFKHEILEYSAYNSSHYTISYNNNNSNIIENYFDDDHKELIIIGKVGSFVQNAVGDLYMSITTEDEKACKIQHFRHHKRYFEKGEVILGPFDSGDYSTRWHKITLESEKPYSEQSNMIVSYSVTDNQPTPKQDTGNLAWIYAVPDPNDTLLDGKGRFLWIKLEFKSPDGRETPIFKMAAVYFPRDTYLRYLPKVYQEDSKSKELLERFLSIFETMFEKTDEKIFSFSKILDPNSTRKEFLPWLASWLAISYNLGWTDKQIKSLIKNAYKLYKIRGTAAMIQHLVNLYLDPNYIINSVETKDNIPDEMQRLGFKPITIIENLKIWEYLEQIKTNPHTKLKYQDYVKLLGDDPYCFITLLDSIRVNSKNIGTIRNIINSEKPAHTVSKTYTLHPHFIVGSFTFLGFNTGLSSKPFTIGQTPIGFSAVNEVKCRCGDIHTKV